MEGKQQRGGPYSYKNITKNATDWDVFDLAPQTQSSMIFTVVAQQMDLSRTNERSDSKQGE